VDHIAHYKIVRRLGAGGMGEVWRAVDERLGRDVAIKLLARGRSSPERALRMLREAQAASGLNHPGIVTVHDIGEVNGHPYLVMELVEGKRFSDLGRVEPAEALRLCALAADALGAAHERGILHRDVKSDNLMCLPDGRVKVLDFGLAKAMGAGATTSDPRERQTEDEPVTPVSPLAATVDGSDPAVAETATPVPSPGLAETLASDDRKSPMTPGTELTRVGDIVGTPAYMAPEQARGEQLDARSEIFSLGVVLYELLTGRRPFLGRDIESTLELVRKASPTPPSKATENPKLAPLDTLVLGALARDPAARPKDMKTMAAQLRAAGGKPPRSRTRLAILAGGGVLALAAGGYFAMSQRSSAPPPAPVADTPKAPAALRVGYTVRLTKDGGCSEFPSISPDGSLIVFDSMRGADYILESLDPKYNRKQLTQGQGWDLAPAISPDGKSVAFLRKSGGPYRTMVSDIGFSSPPREIAQGGMRPRWSPDGKHLWAGSGKKPTRFDIAIGQAERSLVVPAGLALLVPLELANGDVAGVMLKPAEGSEPIGIALFPREGEMRWLYQQEVDEVLALTPDGRLLASRIAESKRELIALSPAGGDPVSLALQEIDARKGLAATPKWEFVTWSDCTDHHDIAKVTRAGAGHDFTPATAADWADAEPAAVGDERLIAIVSDRDQGLEPWLIDLDGAAQPRKIAKVQAARLSVTPDRKTLVYNTGEDAIFKAALDGSGRPLKLADGGGESTPIAGPDGLVYFDRVDDAGQPRVFTVPLAGGAAKPALPPGSSSAAPSPVGKRIVYAQGKPGAQKLVVRELATGAEHALAAELPASGPWHVRFSADGERVVAQLAASDIYVVDVAAGKVSDHVTPQARTFMGAALVGPHGESLVVGENWWRGNIWQGQRVGQ
jgi:serine/threonine protein kinase/Tol biopolymer transport system component